MKKLLFLIVGLVMSFNLFAAGSAESSGTKPAAAIRLAWYAPAPHPYFEIVKRGAMDVAKDFNVEVFPMIGPDWTQDSQTQNVLALAAKGYNGFSIFASDPSAANALYKELTTKGIFVTSFGVDTLKPTTASFYVGTQIKQAAYDACQELINLMGGKGNILNVLGVIEDYNTTLRKEGIMECLAKNPNVKLISEVAGMTTPEMALEKVENALSAHVKEIDGIISTETNGTEAVSKLLTEYHSKGNRYIHFIGIDTEPNIMKAIKAGYVDGTMAQNPYGHGYLSVLLLKYLKEGWTPKDGSYNVNAGHFMVTKANADTYEMDQLKITKKLASEFETKLLNPPVKK
jgi:ribose transport system substrate-binding protein